MPKATKPVNPFLDALNQYQKAQKKTKVAAKAKVAVAKPKKNSFCLIIAKSGNAVVRFSDGSTAMATSVEYTLDDVKQYQRPNYFPKALVKNHVLRTSGDYRGKHFDKFFTTFKAAEKKLQAKRDAAARITL